MSRPGIVVTGWLFAAVSLLGAWSAAQEELPSRADGQTPQRPATDARHYSYAIGLDIGSSFRADQIDLDVEQLVAGIRDGQQAAKPRFTPELCGAAMQSLTERRLESLRKRNEEFLVENRKHAGVEVTQSGLQYQVLKRGEGDSPGVRDVVQVHYQGQLIDGTVFDSSAGRGPTELPVGRFVPGWVEALQKMRVGGQWRLFVPSDLAYGADGFGDLIPPHSTLIFEIELLSIHDGK